MILYHRQEHSNIKQIAACFHKRPSECFLFSFIAVNGSSTLLAAAEALALLSLKTQTQPGLATLTVEFLFCIFSIFKEN